jgi:2',3'-cyclic-nucleotide 2'-phosphodiesterase (5'-nucleotidase family)
VTASRLVRSLIRSTLALSTFFGGRTPRGAPFWTSLLLLLPVITSAADAQSIDFSLLLTADTEGHVTPCQECPGPRGFGGLSRRATALSGAKENGTCLILDAGNAFLGAQSVASQGEVIVAAYNAMHYDAVNLSYRDFRNGKLRTLAMLKDAGFVAVSANLVDEQTAKPLVAPYTIKRIGSQRLALLGLTEAPAGFEFLPHLRKQLTGIRIQELNEALQQWLPKAKAESDRVILLYYGSADGLAVIREKFGSDFLAILVGGMRPEQLPSASDTSLRIFGAAEHGRSIARLQVTGTEAAMQTESAQITIEPALAEDPDLERLLSKYANNRPGVAATTSATAQSNLQPTASAQHPASRKNAKNAGSVAKIADPHEATTEKPVVTTTDPATKDTPSVPAVAPIQVSKRVAAHQQREPAGIRGVNLTNEQVNAAVLRGSQFLWDNLKNEGEQLGANEEHVLACLALVHAGWCKVSPDFDRDLRSYLGRVDPYRIGTYQVGVLCMLIEAYGDPAFFPKLRPAVHYLVEAQGSGGTWGYNVEVTPAPELGPTDRQPLRVVVSGDGGKTRADSQKLARTTKWVKELDGDNSASQFAILGLHAASRCGVKVAPEVWERSLKSNHRGVREDGGWGYNENATSSYGSMTCAGICALAIERFELDEASLLTDDGVERGLGWLADHFSIQANPEFSNYHFYYLYSLERVGRTLDTEFIDAHEWYPLGARYLVDAQAKDGSWHEREDPNRVLPACFALLFLTRATSTLHREAPREPTALLKTETATPPPARLYIILDASGSMLEPMDGKEKFEIARDAVAQVVRKVPDASQVALRVYGHRKRSIEEGADEDTALEIPMGELDREKFSATLNSLRPRGKTPLALSLSQAAGDLVDVTPENPVTVVLLTDGGEDTVPRRDPIKAAESLGAIKGVTLHIVGFDINQDDWSAQLRAMADRAGGHYWPAMQTKVLRQQLCSAVLGKPGEFVILDKDRREVTRGDFGESQKLPQGAYVFTTTYAGHEFVAPFQANGGTSISVVFDATSAEATSKSTVPQSKPARAASGPSAPAATRFCTHCGHALSSADRFCPDCGTSVTDTEGKKVQHGAHD